MTEAPTSDVDVYLSYNARDLEAVGQLEAYLKEAGLSVWAETPDVGEAQLHSVLASRNVEPRFMVVCVGPTGLSEWQLEEVELADARSASDPDFRFVAALLPGVPRDFSSAALPSALASRLSVDLREGTSGANALLAEIGSPSPRDSSGTDAHPPATPSVANAVGKLAGAEVTAARLVAVLLELHPEYGERAGGSVQLEVDDGERALAETWVARVRELLDPAAVTELHGRLLVVGLARLDDGLRAQLEAGGFLAALELEIREPLATLFRDEPTPPEETVPTHTDNPATIDELNRQGIAGILARRIRDTRAHQEGSFLVHVHGPWGSGKTSLLNFLGDELRRPDPQVSEGERSWSARPWVVVTFNAWQHQRLAPPWWWLMTSLYRQGFHELWALDRRRALAFRAREWLWRLRGGWQGIALFLAGVGLFALLWRTGAFDLSEDDVSYEAVKALLVGVAAIVAPLLTIWGVVRSASRWILTASARGARFYMEHASDPMETTKRHFGDLVEWLGHPLVVVVDDLDRCKPAFVVELLEGIQTLFRDVPVAYVVAADREWLANSYASEYTSFEGVFDAPGRPLGYLFLEKTFQITIPIPVLSADTRDRYWRGLIRPELLHESAGLEGAREEAARIFGQLETEEQVREELARNPGATPAEQRARVEAAAIQLATPKLERTAEHVLHPFRPLLEANPRAMKRLVNAYGVARGIELLSRHSLRWEKRAQHQTALWTILGLRWPRLAEYLAAHPDAVARIAADGAAPQDVSTDLSPLFADAEVEQVVLGRAEGVEATLDPNAIRATVSA
jgi:hypothetical protein